VISTIFNSDQTVRLEQQCPRVEIVSTAAHGLCQAHVAAVLLHLLLLYTIVFHTIVWGQTSQPEPPTQLQRPAQIAIIIDDLGYRYQLSKKAVNLPGAVTVSILPHSPHALELATLAHQLGKEVMLHAPMSGTYDKTLGLGALTSDMDQMQFVQVLNSNLLSVPYVKGLNNHMGSELTQERLPMLWLMWELKSRELYFIDSRTSPESQAWEIAVEIGLPARKRDVFLDNDPDLDQIALRFQEFLNIADRRGQAIAIAHPDPTTLTFLSEALKNLDTNAYQLTPISNFLSQSKVQTLHEDFRATQRHH
jgi:polysaccharide deacetylase 2 family uncharacterized protein YibQ